MRQSLEEASSVGTAPATLEERLATSRFVIGVEVDPPKGLVVDRALEGARLLKEAGVDCVNVGDSPLAQTRMSALPMALLIQQQVGLEVIVHFTTRDRNLTALQGDLLGAHALGIRNILVIKGDMPKTGEAKGVWDTSVVGLIRLIQRFNEGVDSAGNPLGARPSFFVGAVVNPAAEDLDAELRRLERKVKAGARFALTQAVFDPQILERFLNRVQEMPIPILAGIYPLFTYRQAEFLNREISGMVIPEATRERLRQAGDGARALGLKLARELIEQVKGRAAGIYLIPSFGHYEPIAELVAWARP